jgi:hypothetical protein
MLQLTPQMRILVAVEAVDFRKGIDSLAELCRAKLNADPFSGCLFVFRSRRATSIKVLVYDGQGFWLATTPRCACCVWRVSRPMNAPACSRPASCPPSKGKRSRCTSPGASRRGENLRDVWRHRVSRARRAHSDVRCFVAQYAQTE